MIFALDRKLVVAFADTAADLPLDWVLVEDKYLAEQFISREKFDLLVADCATDCGAPLIRYESSSRCPVDIPASLRRGDEIIPAKVLTLSEGGMMIHVKHEVPDYDVPRIAFVPVGAAEMQLYGKIAWHGPDCLAGIRFLEATFWHDRFPVATRCGNGRGRESTPTSIGLGPADATSCSGRCWRRTEIALRTTSSKSSWLLTPLLRHVMPPAWTRNKVAYDERSGRLRSIGSPPIADVACE